MVDTHCSRKGDKEVYRQKDNVTGEWKVFTWNEFREDIRKVACALETLGVKEHENIGVFSGRGTKHIHIATSLCFVYYPVCKEDCQEQTSG